MDSPSKVNDECKKTTTITAGYASDDNEFHDAEDNETTTLEEKFSDALDLVVDEPILSEAELLANKEKSELLKQEGNDVFKSGDYDRAVQLYTEAIDICPKAYRNERSILFNNRAAAHKHLGAQNIAIEDCTHAIELNATYIKALARRAALYEETDKLDECVADYKKIVELEPANAEARVHISRLAPIIEERNERLKAEMMGKLKDLGNMILKPFGLSTNNFQMQQDPATGSYSVNFNQSAGK